MSTNRPARSLALRLTLFGAAASLAALIVAGTFMAVLQRMGAEESFDTQLDVTLGLLVGALGDGRLEEGAAVVADPRYAAPASGWYWLVRADDGESLYVSSSLIDPLEIAQEALRPNAEGAAVGTITTGSTRLRVLQRGFIFEDRAYTFTVTGNLEVVDRVVADFRRAVVMTLTVLWLVLMALGFLQIRLGLRPLAAMRAALAELREGAAERMEGVYPREVAPLVSDLNQLLESNAAILERARRHVGNLAHALKTPLAVIANEAAARSGPKAAVVGEQAEAMKTQIGLYLDRARRAADAAKPGTATGFSQTAEPLLRVFSRLNRDSDLRFLLEAQDGIALRVERHDLEEILGNLLENAARYARSRVVLRARPHSEPGWVAVSVADDGPGVAEKDRAIILKRGQRLDEKTPGSGLGLSIVSELAELYGGCVVLDDAAEGGLEATILLPQAARTGLARVSP
ncbi:MAG: HAMP domain-containing histidine kinase [Hyphomicrobiaceae bacterium]|nr:HAMP domain-containing histidine kinase [Hyphomicrobiaceae bacterium]